MAKRTIDIDIPDDLWELIKQYRDVHFTPVEYNVSSIGPKGPIQGNMSFVFTLSPDNMKCQYKLPKNVLALLEYNRKIYEAPRYSYYVEQMTIEEFWRIQFAHRYKNCMVSYKNSLYIDEKEYRIFDLVSEEAEFVYVGVPFGFNGKAYDYDIAGCRIVEAVEKEKKIKWKSWEIK